MISKVVLVASTPIPKAQTLLACCLSSVFYYAGTKLKSQSSELVSCCHADVFKHLVMYTLWCNHWTDQLVNDTSGYLFAGGYKMFHFLSSNSRLKKKKKKSPSNFTKPQQNLMAVFCYLYNRGCVVSLMSEFSLNAMQWSTVNLLKTVNTLDCYNRRS